VVRLNRWVTNYGDAHLVGRDQDIAVVRAFIDHAARHGGSLLVPGEAGVGKTALVEGATEYAAASGLRLLRATGAQFEANVSFAALHQLLFPLLDSNLSRLSEQHRAALNSAFGFRGRTVPDRLALSHAALELLAQSATATPILIVVDDMPWLDQASGVVLAFIARRTAGTRLGFLATARTGEEGFLDRSGLATHELRPLSEASSEALLDSRYPALTTRARRRLLTEARGQPPGAARTAHRA
jgi:predicted ATPase